jgi:CDP-4-dehydro-6-deoxyglucose reductase
MRISLTKSRRSFSVRAGESLLDGALAAGLNLPHSCKSGNCGACRAHLRSGRIEYPRGAPLGLSASEVAEGYVLLCQARAATDLELDPVEIHAVAERAIKRLPCRIDSVTALSHDVLRVMLRLPAVETLDHEPGQYIDVLLTGGRRRSFSLASPPHDAKRLELHVRRVTGGEFTETLFADGAVGRLLEIEGPLGRFTYREGPAPMLLLGGGTGLAPLLSILRHVLENELERELKLYWGVRAERDLYADAQLRALAARYARLHYVPVLSAASDAWDGRRGWVHEAALADLDPCAYDVYASGPPEMIAAVRRDFAARGVAAGRLWFDSFDYAPDALARQATSAATRS